MKTEQRQERTIFNEPKAKRVAAELTELADMLAGLTLEGVRDNPAMLLSPNFRKTLVEKADKLNDMLLTYKHFLCMDIMD